MNYGQRPTRSIMTTGISITLKGKKGIAIRDILGVEN